MRSMKYEDGAFHPGILRIYTLPTKSSLMPYLQELEMVGRSAPPVSHRFLGILEDAMRPNPDGWCNSPSVRPRKSSCEGSAVLIPYLCAASCLHRGTTYAPYTPVLQQRVRFGGTKSAERKLLPPMGNTRI